MKGGAMNLRPNRQRVCRRCGEIFMGGRQSRVCENCIKPNPMKKDMKAELGKLKREHQVLWEYYDNAIKTILDLTIQLNIMKLEKIERKKEKKKKK